MIKYIVQFITKAALLSILAVFILSFFGKYIGMIVYHVNFALFYYLESMFAETTIRSIEIFCIFMIMLAIFKGAKK